MRRTICFLATSLVLLFALPAAAVTITIVNSDANASGQCDATHNTGLCDPTLATPVGGNPGTTIGAQRMNVFQKAAQYWGGILPGNVEIRIGASFATLPCSSTSAVLGWTTPTYVESDFGGGAFPGVWYAVAQANEMAGVDWEPGVTHVATQFNGKLGTSGCLDGVYFYYGLDTNTPAGEVNFLSTALHEFAHGFGFISLADETSGTFCCGTQPQPDIFDAFTFDTTARKSWNEMATDAERKASAVNTGNLVFTGANTNAHAATVLSNNPSLLVSPPAAVAGSYTVGTAVFGAKLTNAGVTGTVVAVANPAGSGTTTDGCTTPLTNSAALSGNIALVDRGLCSFAQKAANVQAAGAIGVVIANNVPGSPPGMASDSLGVAGTVTIPVVSVSQTDGASLRGNLPATATIGLDPSRFAGMNTAGQLLLYAPSPVMPGSSVSHWDLSAAPSLLMEPFIMSDLAPGVDVTPDALRDIGWFGSTPPSQHLTVTLAGTGAGTVTSSPTAVNCPGACGADFSFATSVTLTATASGTSTFAGFSGEGCSGTGTCTVGMSVTRNVTATFSAGAAPPATIVGTAGFANCTGGSCPSPLSTAVGIPVTLALTRSGSPVTSGSVSWQVTSGNAVPSSGSGLTFAFTPQTAGNLAVTASVDGVAATNNPISMTVAAAPAPLMLSSNRVRVDVAWVNPYSGQGGAGLNIPQNDQYGFFYFSDPNDPEVFVKVLDFGTGSALCFVGGLTDFYYKVTFTSVRTGQKIVFEKPAYQYIGYVNNSDLKFATAAPGGMAFAGALGTGGEASTASAQATSDPLVTLPYLDLSTGRVRVKVDWQNPYSGQTGTAFGIPKADQYGFLYYTDPNNPEVFVKVLDFGTGSALVFVGGLTDFYYKVTFTVFRTGQTLVFEKPAYQYIGFVDNSTLKF
ncbi:MAG: PA domain-containing protein [Thermoanaerobaculia bacterium]